MLPLADAWRKLGGKLDGRTYVYFAPDCFHKANVSGGENYHFLTPEPRADFRIIGDVSPEYHDDWSSYGGGQRFVDALRRTFRYGGFRGRVDIDTEMWAPPRAIHLELGKGLLPI